MGVMMASTPQPTVHFCLPCVDWTS